MLNARPGVRRVTIEKEQNAINELGYVRDSAAASLARRRAYNLLFVLPAMANEFVDALRAEIADQAAKSINDRTRIAVASATPFDPAELVAMLNGIDPSAIDGVAIFGPETPSVRDAVTRLRERGVAVISLVSDLPSSVRHHFVGIDNVSAGRTAAQLIGRFSRAPGKILVITGSRLSRDHLERRQGFDLVMAQAFPHLEVVASVEGRDDQALRDQILPEIFATYPDLRGIYASAAGNAGLAEFLAAQKPAQDVVVVGHELTPVTRHALEIGTFDAIISQDTGHLVRSAVRLLRATADNLAINLAQERIRNDIYLKENLPPAPSEEAPQ